MTPWVSVKNQVTSAKKARKHASLWRHPQNTRDDYGARLDSCRNLNFRLEQGQEWILYFRAGVNSKICAQAIQKF